MDIPQGDKPPEIEPLLRAAPKIKQVCWCKYPLAEHQHKPEFFPLRRSRNGPLWCFQGSRPVAELSRLFL